MKRREACVSCYKRKQKCNKQKPCLRCHELGIDCYYEIEKEKEKQKQKVEENDKGKSTSLTRYRKDFTKSRLVDKYSKLLGLFKKVYGINQDIREDVLFGFLTKQMNHSFLYQQKSFLTLVNLNSNQLLKELEPKLIETFFTFNNKIQLLISPEKKSHILVSNNEHDIALKYAICCYTYQTYRYLSNLSPVKLNQIPFYIKAKTLINSLIQKPSIQLLQCSLLLSQQEYGFDCKYKALMSSMFATKLYQILGLNSKLETKDIKSEELAEKYRISLFCINQDLLASFPSAKPSIIPFKKDTLSEDKYGFNINENLIEPYKI
ncbi:hypothetical protein K502DRAFT_158707 [Neoconidiobolus thromboides FSU 785]|nr:hypothetical protein K502DRAFT_158707 [Neoconidiobolus thromboides FSU 785]